MIYRRYVKPILRAMFRSFGKIMRQLTGMIIFVLLAAMETGDWSGIMSRYNNPSKDAISFGITNQQASTNLLVMMVLAISIILAALMTAMGFMRDEKWVLRTSQITGGLYVVYGLYQIYSALVIINQNQQNAILAGIVYAVIGLAVFGLGGKFAGSPKTQVRQSPK